MLRLRSKRSTQIVPGVYNSGDTKRTDSLHCLGEELSVEVSRSQRFDCSC